MNAECRPRILVPLDGSKLARAALEAVLPIVKATNASITLLAVMEPIMDHHFEPFANAEEVSISEAIEVYIEGEARQIAQDTGLETSSQLIAGFAEKPGHVIAEFARGGDFDMIAMSTRGLSGFKRLLLGSVAKQVLQVAETPVLLFPAK